MGDKVYALLIKVDLSCCRCNQAIQDYLCKIQCKEHIMAIVYDVKNNVVRVSGPFDPEQLKKHLLCKLSKIIKGIDIIEPAKPKPPPGPAEKPPEQEKPKPQPKDEYKERCMKRCEEEYEEISKCIEKCKKECEEKCRQQCEDKFKLKCKCSCKCKSPCDCKEKPPPQPQPQPQPPPPQPQPQPPPPQPQPPQWPIPPTYPWPPTICCGSPCPCFVAWSNNYRCCSCGVVSWPGMCGPGPGPGPGPGWGSGQGPWNRSQGGCESNRSPNIVLESSPPCTIM